MEFLKGNSRSEQSVERHNPALESCGYGLSSVLDMQFREQTVHVILNRAFGDVKVSSNFFVTSSADDKPQNIHLSLA